MIICNKFLRCGVCYECMSAYTKSLISPYDESTLIRIKNEQIEELKAENEKLKAEIEALKNTQPLKLEVGKVYEPDNGDRYLAAYLSAGHYIMMPLFSFNPGSFAATETGEAVGLPNKLFSKLVKLSDNQSREIIL